MPKSGKKKKLRFPKSDSKNGNNEKEIIFIYAYILYKLFKHCPPHKKGTMSLS